MEEIPQGHRLSAEEMDEIRQKNIAYQYLCHLEEAKKWIEACIEEDLPEAENLEEEFRHGVFLAKLANFFCPETVSSRKIFDCDLSRYRSFGLHFRHTDNINYFLKALKVIGLPKIFYPETTDIYDKKNVPKAVFCVHALSLYLFRLGIAPQIQNLYGKVKFSDEVMAAMMQELGKFGCQMPQFGKIGGILASELPVDEAALYAAIIAINDAVQKQDLEELKCTLTNPNSHLSNVVLTNADNYLYALHEAYMEKKVIALNKSRDDNYIPDAYDELLTQAEIQGFVNRTNLSEAIKRVEEAIEQQNVQDLWKGLTNETLALKDLKSDLIGDYLTSLSEEAGNRRDHSFNRSLDHSLSNCTLSRAAIQRALKRANVAGQHRHIERNNLERLNLSLSRGTAMETLSALHAMQSSFIALLDYAAPLYHEEMAAVRSDAQEDLTLLEVVGGVRLLTAVGRVNAAIDTEHPQKIWECLAHPEAHVQNLDSNYVSDYVSYLIQTREAKLMTSNPCPLLTYFELQETVDQLNQLKDEDNQKIVALTAVNDAVAHGDDHALVVALGHPSLGVQNASPLNGAYFLQLFRSLQRAKHHQQTSNSEEDSVELWLEDILEVADRVSRHEVEARSLAHFLATLNGAVVEGCAPSVERILRSCKLANFHIRSDLLRDVSENLVSRFASGHLSVPANPWLRQTLQDGSKVYINVESQAFKWHQPTTDGVDVPDGESRASYIGLVDIEQMVKSTMEEVAVNRKIEDCLIRLQAACRGRLARRRISAYIRSAVVIQSWWRMTRVRRSYKLYRRALRLWEPQIVKIQRAFRAWRWQRKILGATERFRGKEHKVVVIQRAWRQYKARMDLHALTHCQNPLVGVVRKFIHLLQVSHFDFEEELRLQRVKGDVVKAIRRTHQLESQIEELDVKIGLLVHNRITVQDVIKPVVDKENLNPNRLDGDSGTKKFRRSTKDLEKSGTIRSQKGLKALTKESRERLIGYQHLFYLLQTQPHYLASLIFALPIGKTTKFIENIIFTLYNYGANDRDNFLLLKLMKTALEEEIRSKVLRLSDIACGNPLVVKMIVSFNRKGAGHSSLRDLLGPLVEKVMTDSQLQINTNPIEIYKTWVNQLEMNSGQPSELPYVVSQEQAMQYPEVQKRLLKAVNALRQASHLFCCHITSSRHLIPYAIQYMAKVMKSALHNRFPHVLEKEVLKVVGNLIYYRFINSAIVAPDAFDIVTLSPEMKLSNEQRRNLASIAKILQFAASKKGFGEEASHLMGLNPFIVECHERFKVFFKECCSVDEPEQVYDVNQYSEATMIIKPTVYMTLQEIIQTHELVLNHEDVIAPDAADPLHRLLRDLGERPSVYKLVGESQENASTINPIGRTEVCLVLSSKFDLQENVEEHKKGKDSNQKLFNKTKQLLVDIVQCVGGDVIHNLITGPTLPQQEQAYHAIVATRAQHEQKAKINDTGLNRSNSFLDGARVSLSEVKTKLSHNLRRLENRGLATRNDNYQALLNAIAKDIVNQRQYRINRRTELQKLVLTSRKLEHKEKFYKDQLNSYTTYLNTCLTNLASRNKNVHQQVLASKPGKNSKSKMTLKYTGMRLHDRGVILEIEDLPPNQMKNVLFEITPLAASGLFQIQIKFMGVAMEMVQLDIQDLLQLQYEGVSVKTMFGKAKINVNLLLHLLNTKFYSKKK